MKSSSNPGTLVPRRRHALYAVATCALAAAGALSHPGALAGPPPGTGAWTLTLNEEFTSSTLNTAIWSTGMRWADAINRELQAYRPENVIINPTTGICTIKTDMWAGAINNASGYPIGATTIAVDGFTKAIPNGTRIRIGYKVTGELKPDNTEEDRMYTVASTVGGTNPTQITLTTPLRHAITDNTRVVWTAKLASMTGYEWGSFDYRSGAIQTYNKLTMQYGYAEARIKMNTARGTWPAFWLLPDRGASSPNRLSVGTPSGTAMGNEIDIMEYMATWKDPGTGLSSSHSGFIWQYQDENQPAGVQSAYTMENKLPSPDTQFHTYGLYWGPGLLVYYIDGIAVFRSSDPTKVAAAPHYLILNCAIDTNDWIGAPVSKADIDADLAWATNRSMEIDYVRIYSGTAGSGTSGDIGAVGVAGSNTHSNGTYTLKASGTDISGSADSFHFTGHPMTGDGTLTARVVSLTNTNAWAKAGVMMRESVDDPKSRHADMIVPAANFLAFQYRPNTGSITSSVSCSGSGTPNWVRITRVGDVFTGSFSSDGVNWSIAGSRTITMPPTIHVGLVATSHNNSVLTTAVFDNVQFTTPLVAQDIGNVGIAGSNTLSSGTYTVQASGSDLGDTEDQFRFLYRYLEGDGSITVRAASLVNTNWAARAALMFRDLEDTSGPRVYVSTSPDSKIRWVARSVLEGSSVTGGQGSGKPPVWLRLTRVGDVFTSYSSTNGLTWTQIGTPLTVPLGRTAMVGIATTSHNNAALTTATYDNLTITGL